MGDMEGGGIQRCGGNEANDGNMVERVIIFKNSSEKPTTKNCQLPTAEIWTNTMADMSENKNK